jgi:hypothetical protein
MRRIRWPRDRICSDLGTQNHLIRRPGDPASPAPDTQPYSGAALRTQLISLDRIQGQVTRCDPGQVSSSAPDRAQTLLVTQRQRQNAPTTVLLVMRGGENVGLIKLNV